LDPICAGSVISSAAGDLIFSNCNYGDEEALKRIRAGENIKWSQNARQNLTIRISEDDGANWSKGIAVEEEAGYSDLAFSLDGKEIYCFYERGWIDGNCIYNEHLAFARVPIASV
jgi:sialidase-1